jgi:hypothetical protein
MHIPDDARDLDRDVQAYHRELRAQRRRARLGRLTGPLVRRGMVIPLVAVCLALTLLSGTLLTVVAGRQNSAAPDAAPSTPQSAKPLPNASVTLDGKQVPLRRLVPAVLAWVPASCSCLTALQDLVKRAAQAHVQMYLVGTARGTIGLPALAQEAGQGKIHVVSDPTNAIGMAYGPIGLTAIMARSDGTVGTVIRGLQLPDPKTADHQLAAALPALASPSPAAGLGTPSASPTQPAPPTQSAPPTQPGPHAT